MHNILLHNCEIFFFFLLLLRLRDRASCYNTTRTILFVEEYLLYNQNAGPLGDNTEVFVLYYSFVEGFRRPARVYSFPSTTSCRGQV